jgi:hypothetical protein
MVAIQSRARALVTLFEDKQSHLTLEASMLCEVSHLNFLNFLKVFLDPRLPLQRNNP